MSSNSTSPSRRVALIGIGMMGTAMAQRLLQCGHVVSLFNRSPDKMAPLVAQGARAGTSAADAVRDAEFVITCLNSAAIVEDAVFGAGGVAEGMQPSTLLIDMSSIAPAPTRRLAGMLRERCGADWVDAPLSGGAPKALLGKLTVMAGGDAAAVARAHEIMRDLCANYTHMGPNGAGQATKLVNQVLCALNNQAVAEAVRLAEACGVDTWVLPKALAGGRADSAALQEFGPHFAARREPPAGAIANMLKDMEGVQAIAHAERLPLPLVATVSELFRTMVAGGLAGEQIGAIMRQFDGYRTTAPRP